MSKTIVQKVIFKTGKNLQLVKDRLIVQTWRAQSWNKEEVDSTFIIYLEPKGKNVILHYIHAKSIFRCRFLPVRKKIARTRRYGNWPGK